MPGQMTSRRIIVPMYVTKSITSDSYDNTQKTIQTRRFFIILVSVIFKTYILYNCVIYFYIYSDNNYVDMVSI